MCNACQGIVRSGALLEWNVTIDYDDAPAEQDTDDAEEYDYFA